MVLTHRGHIQDAVLLEEEFLPRVRILQRAEFIAPALSLGALLEQRRGHEAMALDLVEEFVRDTRDHDSLRLQFLPVVARVLAAHGHVERLAELVSPEPRARNVRTRIALDAAKAVLAEARGEMEEAARGYADVAAAWLRYGSLPERAEALFGEGRSLLAIGDADGTDRLRAARDDFSSLGAAPAVAEIDRVLEVAAEATS